MTLVLAWVMVAGVGEAAPAVDYATAGEISAWLHHPVYGDPSFDTFERAPGNPIRRGAPPFEWPVNGFLFDDPQSRNWYVYVGLYAEGYAMGQNKGMDCAVYRSADQGRSWQHAGPAFPPEPFRFAGDEVPVGYRPDVSVVYEDGKYHMIYDWASANSTWETAFTPANGADNGIAYACAERPEGPFLTTPIAVYRTGGHPIYRGKYRRGYAATLIRRAHDWMVLAMTDSGPDFGWALIGMTAEGPEGPYSEPMFLRCVDDLYFHPPLLEFFPAFQHDGWVYAPATSVARNRNFQAVFRVKTEDAMRPEAWEPFELGSAWHSEDVENEWFGIWGQTFSGMVTGDHVLHVMFPSRDPKGMGTINLASRPWDKPNRERGFVLTGHDGPSLSLIKRCYSEFCLEAALTLRGEGSLLWNYQGPLGPDKPTSDATLHPLSLTRYCALELTPEEWRLTRVDDAGTRHVIASAPATLRGAITVRVTYDVAGNTVVTLNGVPAWTGDAGVGEGALGLLVGAHSHLKVGRFAVQGASKKGRLSYLFTEAILGAGASNQFWLAVKSPAFRYGIGAVSAKPDARAKWNFDGSAFALWAPKGPDYGEADLFVDGVKSASLDFRAPEPEPSRVIHMQAGLGGPHHAVVLQAREGKTPLDALEVEE